MLRYFAYRLMVRACWGNNDIMLKIPDCIRHAVCERFQPETEDVWVEKEGLGIQQLWPQCKDSEICAVM